MASYKSNRVGLVFYVYVYLFIYFCPLVLALHSAPQIVGLRNISIAACQMLICHRHRVHYVASNSFVFGSSIRNTVSISVFFQNLYVMLHSTAY